MVIRSRWTLGFAAALAAATSLTGAQQPTAAPAPSAPLTATIPPDPQITIGRLPNGLRYYIRKNARPEDRAELRLVVNAGSVLEEDDQRGLAHFVEHMAFNGTKHFPKSEIVSFIESLGMRFGADLNASTSFDETIYQLQVPTDKPDVLDKAMLVLEDWAHNVTFDPVEIDKERGVIMEEWRLRRGAGARMQDKYFPVLFKGSRYADRIPIGDPEMNVVQHGPHARLTQFYADWYRPDLMAVIAVGDFDKASIEQLIKTHFTPLAGPAKPKPRPSYPVPGHAGTLYSIVSDKEATSTGVSVYNLQAARDQTTIGAYRRQIVESLYAGMLSTRLDEIAHKPNPPFLGAGVERGLFVRTAEVASSEAVVKDGGVEAGLDSLFTETARVAAFGFTATELAREKANTLRAMEQAVVEKDRHESASFAAEYGRNFTQHEPIPGIVYERDLYQRFLPEITVAEINQLAKTWSPDRNRVVIVTAPDKAGVALPAPAKLADVMASAGRKELTAYTDTVDAQPLLDMTPAAGTIVSTSTKDTWGITEWKLSNGVTVVLKPTDFKEDEIVFRAAAPGGLSLASDPDFNAVRRASQVVALGGLGKFSQTDLPKVLTGKVASANVSFSDTDETISGGGSAKDLETLFQLIYLRFTQPRADADVFKVQMDQLRVQLANQTASPGYVFAQTMNAALTQDHPRARLLTVDSANELSLDKSMAFYKERMADAGNFTFVFVGSFDPGTLRPYVERYLASLPSTGRHETWKDSGVRLARGVVEKRVLKGIEPKSQASITFSGPFQYDQAHRALLRSLSMVLDDRLRQTLREDLGGTYGVSLSPGYTKFPIQQYQFEIAFGCAPDRTDGLVQRTFEEIAKLKAEPPSEQAVKDVRETLLRTLETQKRTNAFFGTELSVRYEYGEDLKDLFGLADIYNAITPAMIQDAAKTYLDTNNYVKGTLFPEK